MELVVRLLAPNDIEVSTLRGELGVTIDVVLAALPFRRQQAKTNGFKSTEVLRVLWPIDQMHESSNRTAIATCSRVCL